jgi:hypothetical protein
LFIGEIAPREKEKAIAIGAGHPPQPPCHPFYFSLSIDEFIDAGAVVVFRFCGSTLKALERAGFSNAVTMDEVRRDPKKPGSRVISTEIESRSALERDQKSFARDVIRKRISGAARYIAM